MATKLTNNTSVRRDPRWSPDGTKIAFDSSRDGNLEIYTMNADGTGQTRITNNAAFDGLARLVPGRHEDRVRLGPRRLHGEIYTMNADGTGVTRFTTTRTRDSDPTGRRTARRSSGSRAARQLRHLAMNSDGPARQTSPTQFRLGHPPNWAPDGTKIAFAINRDGQYRHLPDEPGRHQADARRSARPSKTNVTGLSARLVGPHGRDPRYPLSRGRCSLRHLEVTLPYSNGSSMGAIDEAADWQPINRSYARPRGATPVRISRRSPRVPCASPTTTHRGGIRSPRVTPRHRSPTTSRSALPSSTAKSPTRSASRCSGSAQPHPRTAPSR